MQHLFCKVGTGKPKKASLWKAPNRGLISGLIVFLYGIFLAWLVTQLILMRGTPPCLHVLGQYRCYPFFCWKVVSRWLCEQVSFWPTLSSSLFMFPFFDEAPERQSPVNHLIFNFPWLISIPTLHILEGRYVRSLNNMNLFASDIQKYVGPKKVRVVFENTHFSHFFMCGNFFLLRLFFWRFQRRKPKVGLSKPSLPFFVVVSFTGGYQRRVAALVLGTLAGSRWRFPRRRRFGGGNGLKSHGV